MADPKVTNAVLDFLEDDDIEVPEALRPKTMAEMVLEHMEEAPTPEGRPPLFGVLENLDTFPAQTERVSAQKHKAARDRAVEERSRNVFGRFDLEAAKATAEWIRAKELQDHTGGGSPVTGVIAPGAQVPHFEYEGATTAPEFAQLKAHDQRVAGDLEAQGAGWLDALRPQTFRSQAGLNLENFHRMEDRLQEDLETIKDIGRQWDGLADEQRAHVLTSLQAYNGMPEVLKLLKGVATGALKGDDVALQANLKLALDPYKPTQQDFDDEEGWGWLRRRYGDNRLIESRLMYGLRLINTPFAIAGGTIEGIASDLSDPMAPASISSTIGRYLREGRGIPDAISQIAGRTAEMAGEAVDSVADVGAARAGEAVGTTLGYLLGFAAEVYAPDPWVTGVTQAAKTMTPKVNRLVDISINAPEVSRVLREYGHTPGTAREAGARVKELAAKHVDMIDPKSTTPITDATTQFIERNASNGEVFAVAGRSAGASPEERVENALKAMGLDSSEKAVKSRLDSMHSEGFFDNVTYRTLDTYSTEYMGEGFGALSDEKKRELRQMTVLRGSGHRMGRLLAEAVDDTSLHRGLTGHDRFPQAMQALRRAMANEDVGLRMVRRDLDAGGARAFNLYDVLTSTDEAGTLARKILGRAVARDVARNSLMNGLSTGLGPAGRFSPSSTARVLASSIARATRRTFVPTEALPGVRERFRALADRWLTKTDGGYRLTLDSPEERRELWEFLRGDNPLAAAASDPELKARLTGRFDPSKGIDPQDLVAFDKRAHEELTAADPLYRILVPGKPHLSNEDFNTIVDALMDKAARQSDMWIDADRVSDIIYNLSRRTQPNLIPTPKEFVQSVRAENLRQQLFVPKELRNAMVLSSTSGVMRRLGFYGRGTSIHPVVDEFISALGNEFGAVFDEFKVLESLARKDDPELSYAQAAFRVMGEAFQEGRYNRMFEEYLYTIYGAINRHDEAWHGTSLNVRAAADIAPEDAAKLVDALLGSNNYLQRMRELFSDTFADGNFDDAANILRLVHIELQGRRVQSMIDIEDVGPEVAELFRRYRSHAPVMPVKDFTRILAVTYTQRRQVQAIKRVLADYADQHPGLFTLATPYHNSWFTAASNTWRPRLKDCPDTVFILDAIEGSPKLDKLRAALARIDILDYTAHEVNRRVEVKLASRALEDTVPDVAYALGLIHRWVDDSFGLRARLLKVAVDPDGGTGPIPYIRFKQANRFQVEPLTEMLEERQDELVEVLEFWTVRNAHAAETKRTRTINRFFTKEGGAYDTTITPDQQKVIDSMTGMGVNPYTQQFVKSRLRGAVVPGDQASFERVEDSIRRSIRAGEHRNFTTPLDEMASATQLKGPRTTQQLIGRSNIKGLTETLNELVLPTGNRLINDAEVIELGEAVAEEFERIRKAAEGLSRPADEVGTAILKYGQTMMVGLDNYMKSAVLGGFYVLPNMSFLATNLLTGPFIALQSLGGGGALASMYHRNGFDVVNALFGAPSGLDKTIKLGDHVYTTSELAKIVARRGLTRSQASAELSVNLLDDFVAYSGREASGRQLGAAANLKRRHLSPSKRESIFNRAATYVDSYYRVNVLLHALDEGRTMDDAVRLAQEALFDYGSLSSFEKKVLARWLWFYTFWSRSLIATTKNVVQNPGRLAKMYRVQQAGNAFGGDKEDRRFLPDYAQTRVFNKLIEDREAKQRYMLMGPSVPQAEALAELVEYVSVFALLADPRLSTTEAAQAITRTAVEVPASKLNPVMSAAISALTGWDLKQGRPQSNYLDPRLVAYLQESPYLWEVFNSWVEVEAITDRADQNPGMATYMGAQWRVKDSSKGNWAAFRELLLAGGIQRTLRDYAEVVGVGQAGPASDIVDYRIRSQSTPEYLGRFLGVVDPIDAPTGKERENRVENHRVRSFEK